MAHTTELLHSPASLAGYLYEFCKHALAEATPERREFTEAVLRDAVRPEVRAQLEALWEERP